LLQYFDFSDTTSDQHNRLSPTMLARIFFLMLISLNGFGQLRQQIEVGGGLGTLNYTGDLSRTYNFSFSRPAATVFYRYNLSHVISLKTGFTFGSLAASDKTNPIDAAAGVRNASFKVSLAELAPVFEYHFLDWRDARNKVKFTPYLFTGLGMFFFSRHKTNPSGASYSNVQLSLPVGGGIKYVISPYWYVAAEFGIRKTFFDELDNVSGGLRSRKTVSGGQYAFPFGNKYDLDNYFFLGFTLSHTFYQIPCASAPY
jgi:hypothetical protein